MPVQFSIPSAPKLYSMGVSQFRGVDLYSPSGSVDKTRSPEAPNMMRDQVGSVKKRTGYTTEHTFTEGKINGVFLLRGWATGRPGWWPDGRRLVHVGTSLYIQDYTSGTEEVPAEIGGTVTPLFVEEEWQPEEPTPGDDEQVDLWDPATGTLYYRLITAQFTENSGRKSWGVQFGSKFYILTGEDFWVWDGQYLKRVRECATVPTVIISAAPSGGGVSLQPRNLLSDSWVEQFKGEAATTQYHLSEQALQAVEHVWVLLDGEWTETFSYTADLEAGTVTFETAPGAPQVSGTDNVRIQVKKVNVNAGRITGCTFGVRYGVNGQQDRLFLSGNRDHPNLDFYSELDDPTCFFDTSYCVVGQDEGEIVGYSTMGNRLVTHKSGTYDGHNLVVRSGTLTEDGDAAFPVTNIIRGEGAVAAGAFAQLNGEPLFLTERGIFAIASADVTGERYGQQRCLYLSPAIQQEADLAQAVATVWRNFYVLAAGGSVYLLDGLQKSYAKDEPMSSYQYEGYYWTDVPARVIWAEGDTLCFGTEDGRLCRFKDESEGMSAYTDETPEGTKAINAWWDTPDLSGSRFFGNKTFRYVAVLMASAPATGVDIWAQVKGLWRKIYADRGKALFWDWSWVDLSRISFSADRTPRTVGGKIKLKKLDKVRLRLQNDRPNETFTLYALGMEYTEPGSRYKG